MWITKTAEVKLLVTSKDMKEDILHLSHDTLTSGHTVQRKTIEKVKQRFIWYGMTRYMYYQLRPSVFDL